MDKPLQTIPSPSAPPVDVVQQRRALMHAYLRGEDSLTGLCQRFGVSRKTAYKWLARYDRDGTDGLVDRSRAPHSNSRSPSDDVVESILAAKRMYPQWGPRKIRSFLLRERPGLRVPAASTIASVLRRHAVTHSVPVHERSTPSAHVGTTRNEVRSVPRPEPAAACVERGHDEPSSSPWPWS